MFQKLMPTRQDAQPTVKILSDFDALVSENVGFKFHGRIYILKPVDVENFMRLTLAYQDLLKMVEARSQGQELTQDEVYKKYYDLIHPLVPDFSYDDLKALNVVLLNQLVSLCFRQLAGDPSLYEKKNSLT